MAFEEIAVWLFELIKSYGAISVFLGVVLEEVIVPIPSPLVIMGAGVLLIPPGISISSALSMIFFTIVIPAALGTVVGSFFVYGIGYFGGKPLLKRFGRFVDFKWKDVEKSSKRLGKGKKVWLSIAVLRAVPVFPTSPVSFLAGALRLDPKKYAIATFIGSIPRIFVLAFLGWYFGSAYATVAGSFSFIENMLLISVLLIIAYFLYKHHKHIVRHMDHHVGRHVRKHIKKLQKKK